MAAAACDELVESDIGWDVVTPVEPPLAAAVGDHDRHRRQVEPYSAPARWEDGMAEFMGPIEAGDD